MEIFFVKLGISKQVYETSKEAHFNEPHKAEDIKAAILEGTQEGKTTKFKELTRSQVLDYVT
jgi:hypothetical protein